MTYGLNYHDKSDSLYKEEGRKTDTWKCSSSLTLGNLYSQSPFFCFSSNSTQRTQFWITPYKDTLPQCPGICEYTGYKGPEIHFIWTYLLETLLLTLCYLIFKKFIKQKRLCLNTYARKLMKTVVEIISTVKHIGKSIAKHQPQLAQILWISIIYYKILWTWTMLGANWGMSDSALVMLSGINFLYYTVWWNYNFCWAINLDIDLTFIQYTEYSWTDPANGNKDLITLPKYWPLEAEKDD